MKKIIISLLSIILLCSCGRLSKPEGMSDKQYQRELETIQEAKEKIKNHKEGFPHEAHITLGLHSSVLNDNETAIKSYKAVLEVLPNNYLALNNLASVYDEIGKKEEALSLFKQLSILYPANYEAVNDSLRLFVELKRNEEGLRFLEDFIRNYPNEKTEVFKSFISNEYQSLNIQ
jgi:tetratricopeptide (TPR) repeat protein